MSPPIMGGGLPPETSVPNLENEIDMAQLRPFWVTVWALHSRKKTMRKPRVQERNSQRTQLPFKMLMVHSWPPGFLFDPLRADTRSVCGVPR